MIDFDRARRVMVDNQLRPGGVMEQRLLARMLAVPRELFVPEARRELAYVDALHQFGAGRDARFMAAPTIVARLLQLAEITATDAVLDVGAATGYATAVIAGLAETVIGLEPDPVLAERANANLAQLEIANGSVVSGAIDQFGTARFDVIVVEGMLDAAPDAFINALRDGGRLVALIQTGGIGVAHVFVKAGGRITPRADFNAHLPPVYLAPQQENFVF
jgi:protein-L-isoaspartate(D-aspartate) O-methyltransferase